MICHFKNKSLRAIWEKGVRRGVPADHLPKIMRILDRLNVATCREDMDLPGWRLHALKGELSGYWAVTVQANWRIVFRFEDGDARDVDYVDYH